MDGIHINPVSYSDNIDKAKSFYLKEELKKQFDLQGITISFPQMDVNIKK